MRNRWSLARTGVAILVGISWCLTTAAGDHQDGSQVQDEAAADITGLWAFVPNQGDRIGPLVVAMGVRPYALSRSDIGSDHDYSFRIRSAALTGRGSQLQTRTGPSELRLTCRFNRTREVQCDLNEVSAQGVASLAGRISGDFGQTLTSLDRRIRVFADLRTDPYHVNLQALHSCMDTGEVQFLQGDRRIKNSFAASHINTVGIIAEIDRNLLPRSAGMPLVAVAAESVLATDTEQRRIDRAGRPEVSVFLIQEDGARNAWNSRDAFNTSGLDDYRPHMQRGLTAVDALSRKSYWNRPHPLLNVMIQDFLLLNPDVSVSVLDNSANHFMELEWAAYTGRSMEGLAGGRRFVDNSVAKFFQIFARQGLKGFAHLEALRLPLYRPTHANMPYMSAALGRSESIIPRALESFVHVDGQIVGCE